MAHQTNLLIFVAILSANLVSISGKLECEDLPVELCAFAISSTGERCVLEKSIKKNDVSEYECQTSTVTADGFSEWVEEDACITFCGLERMHVGMSSDDFTENTLTESLCSAFCQENCPNLIELYTKLAAGEGVYLPQLCENTGGESRRIISESLMIASKPVETMNVGDISPPPGSWPMESSEISPDPASPEA